MSQELKVLMVAGEWPEPTNAGGRQRTNLLWNALRSCAHTHLLLQNPATDAPAGVAERLKAAGNVHFSPLTRRGARGAWRLARPLSPRIVDRLAHNLGSRRVDYAPDPGVAPAFDELHARVKFDVVVSRYLLPLARCGALGKVRCIVDVDDLDTQVYQSRIEVSRGWRRAMLQHHLNQLQEIVPGMLARCAHRWVITTEDLATIGADHTSILPNIPFNMPGGTGPVPAGSQDAMIVASWTHRINWLGVARFLKNSWPEVLRRAPKARLRLVGSGMSDALRQEWSRLPGVDVIGTVDDLSAEYARAAVCLVPLFEGGGSKIKVLEALAFGRPVVVTHHSLRGYNHVLREGESLLAASDDEGFAIAVAELLGDPVRAATLAETGQRLVRTHFSRDEFFSIVRRDLVAAAART
ncbi:MAG: glycosyltransferase [Phycisphaerales bacterium]|jgi:glycosyltransferase involved in cell wall biosynthesis